MAARLLAGCAVVALMFMCKVRAGRRAQWPGPGRAHLGQRSMAHYLQYGLSKYPLWQVNTAVNASSAPLQAAKTPFDPLPGAPKHCSSELRKQIKWGAATSAYQVLCSSIACRTACDMLRSVMRGQPQRALDLTTHIAYYAPVADRGCIQAGWQGPQHLGRLQPRKQGTCQLLLLHFAMHLLG